MTTGYHAPIMVKEVLDLLAPERGGIYIDGTLGGGGHAEAVLKAAGQNARLVGIDRDEDAILAASARLFAFKDRFTPVRGNFFDMRELLAEQEIFAADGILLDLGVSSHQLDTPERGFSYQHDAPLDMRMDKRAKKTAYDVVNTYTHGELARVLREYGEERYASKVASRIVKKREEKPIETTFELSEIIKHAFPPAKRYEQHPARRSFQGIRIEVNAELEGLEAALRSAHGLLSPGGRLLVITFHSLEDRIVKKLFREFENPCTCPPSAPLCICGKKQSARILTKKPVIAGQEEQEANPRSRSAKLRAIEKMTDPA
ncbi:16S rRNA (cytosine(1402)-N(4))-methyltransferase RsmH [Christensenellaceae bacterium OttesenSCG-928-M15]|nr:16S rRNA (cytosine(1402)-N(4))-methyltransferase RsmH [Christensenellaceae bacterium OttesenSCG-928-M15]